MGRIETMPPLGTGQLADPRTGYCSLHRSAQLERETHTKRGNKRDRYMQRETQIEGYTLRCVCVVLTEASRGRSGSQPMVGRRGKAREHSLLDG